MAAEGKTGLISEAVPQAQDRPLLERVRQRMRAKHYSLRTEATYVQWIRRFIIDSGKRHPRDMGVLEVEGFLTRLAIQAHVSAPRPRTRTASALAAACFRGFLPLDRSATMDRRSFVRPRKLMRTMRTVLLSILALLLCACTTAHVMVGKARPPIPPEQVKVYFERPAKYQEIAILEASGEIRLPISAGDSSDRIIERLKREAGALGANGLFLWGLREQPAGGVGAGNYRAGVGVGFKRDSGMALAVYVEETP